jgi:plastocyanin
MRIRGLTSFSVALVLSACGGGDPIVVVDNTVASVDVTANATTIAPGGTTQLTAIPKNVAGTAISGLTATWSSSNQAAATVSATGLVTGVANGNATITATVSGKSGTRAIIVATITPVQTANVQATVGSAFSPAQVDLTAGGTVTWQFASLAHNVTFSTTAAGTPANIPDTFDANVSRSFPTAGSFPYRCTIHAGMTGTIIVH